MKLQGLEKQWYEMEIPSQELDAVTKMVEAGSTSEQIFNYLLDKGYDPEWSMHDGGLGPEAITPIENLGNATLEIMEEGETMPHAHNGMDVDLLGLIHVAADELGILADSASDDGNEQRAEYLEGVIAGLRKFLR